MTEREAVTYILLHFSRRKDTLRRNDVYIHKSLGYKRLPKYCGPENFDIYFDLKNTYKKETELIAYFATFIKTYEIKVAAICHLSEIIVGREYDIEEQKIVMSMGKYWGLSEETINNIMHTVLLRETLAYEVG